MNADGGTCLKLPLFMAGPPQSMHTSPNRHAPGSSGLGFTLRPKQKRCVTSSVPTSYPKGSKHHYSLTLVHTWAHRHDMAAPLRRKHMPHAYMDSLVYRKLQERDRAPRATDLTNLRARRASLREGCGELFLEKLATLRGSSAQQRRFLPRMMPRILRGAGQ